MISDIGKMKQFFFDNPNLIHFADEDLQRQILEAAIEDDISSIECIWQEVSENLQREYLAEIIAMDQYGDLYFISSLWCATRKQVQEDNPEMFIEIIRLINREDDCMEIVMENTSENLKENVLQALLKINNLKKLPISLSLARKIVDTTSCDISIILEIKDASELTVEQLQQLEESLKIDSIKIGNKKYGIDRYKTCRRAIDKIIEGIDLQANPDNPNREKYIYGQVIKRLANHISNDDEFAEKERNGEVGQDERDNARNLVGALILGACVCEGFAEAARNVFLCLGIECINIGNDEHMWNQIKLDGEWFNMDLQRDRENIMMNQPQYLLKSDEDFKGYNTTFPEKKKCNRTIPINELMNYILYGQQFEINPRQIANVGIQYDKNTGDLQRMISKMGNHLVDADKGVIIGQ